MFLGHSVNLSLRNHRRITENPLKRQILLKLSEARRLSFSFTFVVMALAMGSCVRSLDDQLVAAAYEGDTTRVQALLQKGANVEAHARDDWTPLTIAAREGHNDAMLALLKAGAKPNSTEGGGNTALFWATYYRHVDTVRLLIANGADVNHRCGHCKSALQVAMERNYAELVEVLRKAGAVG